MPIPTPEPPELIAKLREELRAVALIGPDYRAALQTVAELEALLTAQAQEIAKLEAEAAHYGEQLRLIERQGQEIATLKAQLVDERVKGHGEGQEHTIADVNAGRVDDLILPRLSAYGQQCWSAGYKQAEELAAIQLTRAAQEIEQLKAWKAAAMCHPAVVAIMSEAARDRGDWAEVGRLSRAPQEPT